MITDDELVEMISASLHRQTTGLAAPTQGLRDVRHRIVRRRRVGTATVGAVVASGLAVAAVAVSRHRDGATVTDVSTSRRVEPTSSTTAAPASVPGFLSLADLPAPLLWPAYLPNGVVLTKAEVVEDESFPGKRPIVGLLGRPDAGGVYTTVRLELSPNDIQGPSDQDEPVVLADGTEAFFTSVADSASVRVLRFEASGYWVYLSSSVPDGDIVALASQLRIGTDGSVALDIAASTGWVLLQPAIDYTGRRLTAAWYELGGITFVLTTSWLPPDLVERGSTLTVEHIADGEVWHVGGWVVLHRNDGIWLAARAKLAISPEDAIRILLSMRTATDDEAGQFVPFVGSEAGEP